MGHIVPALAVAAVLQKQGHKVFWIGSKKADERAFVEARGIEFFSISTGKFRRYFSIRNLATPFAVLAGYFQARGILRRMRPDALFSKGGFVSVPPALAAAGLGIPVVTHESDASCGLSTRIIARRADVVCLGQEQARIKTGARVVFTGNPIRADLNEGDGESFRRKLGIGADMPVVLVLGGSQGARRLSDTVVQGASQLTGRCRIVLQTGKGKLYDTVPEGVIQFESFDADYADALAAADVVVSRAGAGAVAELQAAGKPAVLVPLGTDASRGDQIRNAELAGHRGTAVVAGYDEVIEKTAALVDNDVLRKKFSDSCARACIKDGAQAIAEVVLEVCK